MERLSITRSISANNWSCFQSPRSHFARLIVSRPVCILRRAVARSVTDDVDRALCVVAIRIGELHGGEYTLDDLREWFLENYDGELEEHLEYIQTVLADLC